MLIEGREEEERRRRAKNLRCQKPIARDLNLDAIRESVWEMLETCEDVRWMDEGDDTYINLAGGLEDETYELKLAFSDLYAELCRFQEDLENEYVPACFDELFPAAGADYAGGYLGFDEYEGDYYGLEPYEYGAAEEAAGKRTLRMTKKELLEAVGACLKIANAYTSLSYRYHCLEAAAGILRGTNHERLKLFKKIEEQYEKLEETSGNFSYINQKEVHEFDKLLSEVQPEYWVQ